MTASDLCYFAPLDIDWTVREILYETLDSAECARAHAFDRPLLTARFVTAHGLLRALLSDVTGMDAASIIIASDAAGRPALRGGSTAGPLQFNLSHSEGWMMLGLSRRTCIGVDIEVARHLADPDRVLAHILSAHERAIVRAAVAEGRCSAEAAVHRCWTLKEATLKAHGAGLAIEPNRVLLEPGELAAALEFDCVTAATGAQVPVTVRIDGEGPAWSVICVRFPPGAAAVARPVGHGTSPTLDCRMLESPDLHRLANAVVVRPRHPVEYTGRPGITPVSAVS